MPTASAVNADILLNDQATEGVSGNLGPRSSLAFLTMLANVGHHYSFSEVSGDRTIKNGANIIGSMERPYSEADSESKPAMRPSI